MRGPSHSAHLAGREARGTQQMPVGADSAPLAVTAVPGGAERRAGVDGHLTLARSTP